MQKPKLLDNNEAAEFLGVTPSTLRVWRATRRYSIPYTKLGSLVRYDPDDLLRWLDSRKIDEVEQTA